MKFCNNKKLKISEHVSILPGLLKLNLNITFENDMTFTVNDVERFKKLITDKNIIVHNVLENMVEILKTKSSRRNIESRKCLEIILHVTYWENAVKP